MATNTKLDSLVINYLTQSQYDSAKNRPKVNTYCPFGLNVTTSGQIFGPAVCIIKTTGEIQVYTGKNNATFGNNSYGWTTNNPNTISWDY